MGTNSIGPDQDYSGVAQTANLGGSTSTSSGAAKIFREFKWGLLTLFILMAVVVCLVYDGGRNKKKGDAAQTKPGTGVDTFASGDSPGGTDTAATPPPSTAPSGTATNASGTDTVATGDDDRTDRPDTWRVNPHPNTPVTRPGGAAGTNGNLAGGTGNGLFRRQPNHLPEPGGDSGTASNSQDDTGGRHTARAPRASETHEATPGHAEHGANAGFKTYVVKAGDSLSKIASENLPGKGGLKAITDANKDALPDINRLREGMKLKIPNTILGVPPNEIGGKTGTDRNPSRQETARGEASRPGNGGERRNSDILTQDDYVVQSGDSLERIARKVLNDPRKWKNLLEWNKDRVADESKLRVGTVLRTRAPNSPISPAGAEGIRTRRNTIRAEAEYPPEDSTDGDRLPNAEVVQISPIAANSKATLPQKYEKAEKNATPKHTELKIPGEVLPEIKCEKGRGFGKN